MSTTITIQSDSTQALTVAPEGSSNYGLQVAESNGAATGLKIAANAADLGVGLSALSSASSEALTIDAKGSGKVVIAGVSSGGVILAPGEGSVGIGTASPAAKLDVAQLSNGTTNHPLIVRNTSNTGNGGGSGTGLQFILNNSGSNTVLGQIDGVNDVLDQSTMIFSTANGEVMRLRNGKVGVGTTSPAAKLDVAQLDNGAVNHPLIVRNTSNTGDGGGSGTGLQLVLNNSGANTVLGQIDGVNDVVGQTTMVFSTANGEVMRLRNGNVGVGTTSPQSALDVNGVVTVSGVTIRAGSGVPSVTAANGSLYLRTDGTGPNLYVRENGAWVPK